MCNGDSAGQGSGKSYKLEAKGNCAGDAAGCNAGTKSTKNRETHIRLLPLTIFCGGIVSVTMGILKVS